MLDYGVHATNVKRGSSSSSSELEDEIVETSKVDINKAPGTTETINSVAGEKDNINKTKSIKRSLAIRKGLGKTLIVTAAILSIL